MSKHKRQPLQPNAPIPLPLVVKEEPAPSSPQDPRCCGNCQYHQKLEEAHGKCRRYPPHIPSLALTSSGPFGIFPITLSTELCGEYKSFLSQ